MKHKRRAFSVLLAVVLVGAVGLTLGLLARHFVGMARSVRFAELDVHASQLLADGREWASHHASQCAALAPGESIALPTDGLVPSGAEAELRITRSADGHDLIGTAMVGTGGLISRCESTIPTDSGR